MTTIDRQAADPCVRPEWSDKPGFWDPLAVVEVCIPILAREVYPANHTIHSERPSALHTRTVEHPKKLCRGISMYLEAWQHTEGIEKAVQRYIYYPCQMELEETVMNKPERALAFILAYLKYRGPFFTWVMRNGEDGVATGRAAIHIGRHLNYLLAVSHGHNIHYLKSIIAKVWGPLYLHVELERVTYPMKRLSEPEKVQLATEVFSRMLETVTWSSLKPFEGVRRNIPQDRHARLIRYENVTGQYVQDQLKEPKFNGTNIGDLMHNAAIQQAMKKDHMRAQEPCSSQWNTTEPFMKSEEVCQDIKGYCQTEKIAVQPCRAQAKPTVPFPPDQCQISHGMHYQKEKRP
uniref:Uncharacterized protein n=1 Tax=Schistocephalus solidus TaxID=70667 RepID=A0A0X3P6X3_SCHSO